MGAAWNSLGALAFQRGDLEQAEHLVAKGLELEPRVRFGAYNEGRILEARGDRAATWRSFGRVGSTRPSLWLPGDSRPTVAPTWRRSATTCGPTS